MAVHLTWIVVLFTALVGTSTATPTKEEAPGIQDNLSNVKEHSLPGQDEEHHISEGSEDRPPAGKDEGRDKSSKAQLSLMKIIDEFRTGLHVQIDSMMHEMVAWCSSMTTNFTSHTGA